HAFWMVPAQDYVAQFLATFKAYPPRQKAASFTLDDALEVLQTGGASKSLKKDIEKQKAVNSTL
ncbi:MAG: hypothetical protein ACO36E_04245, partial [Synechocystis sp.]